MSVSNLILGITGSIASGKSLIASEFEKLGAARVDADQLAREIVAQGSPVLAALVVQFGAGILLASGALDREALGQLVFADPAAREQLNRIVHPAIAELAIDRLRTLQAERGVPLIVYEAPLLFEAGAEGRVDQVLVVRIDPEIQLQRLMARDQLDAVAAQQRVAAQMSQQEKLARADYVIDNSGTVEVTLQQVDELWQRLTGKATGCRR